MKKGVMHKSIKVNIDKVYASSSRIFLWIFVIISYKFVILMK
jgi:hypothetical protein